MDNQLWKFDNQVMSSASADKGAQNAQKQGSASMKFSLYQSSYGCMIMEFLNK